MDIDFLHNNITSFCFAVFIIIRPEHRKKFPLLVIFSLDSSVQCCPMLLLWAWVWSNLAGAAWPLSCCCQEPHCDDDDGLSWPRPHSSLSSSPHSSKLMVPVMWRLSLPPSSHCSMAQLSRTDCLPASARHVAVTPHLATPESQHWDRDRGDTGVQSQSLDIWAV